MSAGKAYREPLCIITLADGEQGLQRIIPRDYEAGNIGKELSADVEEDEEEVGCDKTEESVNLRNRGLLLQFGQSRVL